MARTVVAPALSPAEELDRFAYSVAEVARHLSITTVKVYDLLHRGELVGVKLGRRTVIRREELVRCLDSLPRWEASAS